MFCDFDHLSLIVNESLLMGWGLPLGRLCILFVSRSHLVSKREFVSEEIDIVDGRLVF